MITIEINERTKAGKALLEVARLFSEEEKGVKIIEESPYDKKFVKKIKDREESANGAKLTRLNPDNIWENL